MAELKIDIDGINKKVIPLLDKAKTELEEAANSLFGISYSPDYYKFTNRSRVQSVLPQNIRNIKTNINNINKWLGDIETRFQNADKKNNNEVNSLLSKLDKVNFSSNIGKTGGAIVGVTAQSMAMKQDAVTTFVQKGFELAETLVNEVQNGINSVGAKISSVWDSFYNKIVEPGINFFEECKAKVSNFVTGAINEISNGINKIKDGITSFAQTGWNKAYEMGKGIGDAFNSVGAWISSTWDSFCTEVWPNIWDGIQSTIASVSNVVIGLVKGLAQFVESLVDVVFILGTAIGSIGTGIYDGISYLVSLANGTSDEWESATGAMWQWTMGFVAEDHVGDAFADFYKNNAVGQWLDEHAIDACKSDGIVTNIASGIGYVAGIIILTICTLGVGTAISAGATTLSFATTSAIVATVSGTGKYTQEAWGEARDSSWEGIERLYEKGEITEEEYNTFTAIRSMTDDQWAEIEKDYKDGKISEEEFEQIKQIREMPEDWKTFENGWKGLLYGVANGVWEGVQWYVGGKLAGWAIKGHQIATSAVRVGTDTAFNALDTPFRTAIDSVTSGMTWDQAWEEQGGWESLFTNVGIGLVGSAGGEIFDGVKLNKASKILNSDDIFDSLDEVTSKELKDALLYAQQTGKINLSKMDEVIRDKIIKSIKEMDLAQLSKKEMNEIFDEMSTLFSSKKFKNSTLEEQKEKIDSIINKKINQKEILEKEVKENLLNDYRAGKIDLSEISDNDLDKAIKDVLESHSDTNSITESETIIKEIWDEISSNSEVKAIKKMKKETQKLYKNFFTKQDYITNQQIKEAFENIEIMNRNEFDEMLKNLGWRDDLIPNIGALNHQGKIYYPVDHRIGQTEMIHEVNHTLGNVRFEPGDYGTFYLGADTSQRGINEACTEKLAMDIAEKEVTNTAFSSNIDRLNEISDILEQLGYKDVIYHTYFGKNKTYFAQLIDAIGGKGMYDEIAYYMDIADGSARVLNHNISKEDAAVQLRAIVNEFRRKAGVS